MNPSTAIAPRRIVRRANARRWHLLDTDPRTTAGPDVTYCGQRIPRRTAHRSTAFNAATISCTDCLVAAIGRAP